MKHLNFGLENFTVNTAYWQSVDALSLAIESEVTDIEFREVKGGNEVKNTTDKSSIGDRVKKGIAALIAWFKEKMARVGDFIKNFYYKNRYKLNNSQKSVKELIQEMRYEVYKHFIDMGNKELAEKIKNVTVNQYTYYVFKDMTASLAGSDRVSEMACLGRLVTTLDAASKDIKICWSEVKSNNSDVNKYLDNIEKQNDEFERILAASKDAKLTPQLFMKALDDMSKDRTNSMVKTIDFCNELNKESEKVLGGYSGDVARITRVMAQYTTNFTKIIKCSVIQNNALELYFGVGNMDPEERMDRDISNFNSCIHGNN